MTRRNKKAALIRQRKQNALKGVVEPYSRNKANGNKAKGKAQSEKEENCTIWYPVWEKLKGIQREIWDCKARVADLLVSLRHRVF